MISFSVGVTLPIWREKIQAGIHEAAAERISSSQLRESEQLTIQGRLRRLLAEIDALDQQHDVYLERIVPRAEQALKITASEYTDGWHWRPKHDECGTGLPVGFQELAACRFMTEGQVSKLWLLAFEHGCFEMKLLGVQVQAGNKAITRASPCHTGIQANEGGKGGTAFDSTPSHIPTKPSRRLVGYKQDGSLSHRSLARELRCVLPWFGERSIRWIDVRFVPPMDTSAHSHKSLYCGRGVEMLKSAAGQAPIMTNQDISEVLHEVANLLEAQAANPYRIGAYRTAALSLLELKEPARELLDRKGTAGLRELSGVGRSIANHIAQLLETGRLPLLDRLRGDYRAERAFATVPDIGPRLAHRIHEHLQIESLAELLAAAADGRLAEVPGMGTKRIRAVRESLAGRLRNDFRSQEISRQAQPTQVPVAELLDIDAEYRRLAQADQLPKIAPRRFNPTAAAWLPILHTSRGDRHYTAMFSNTMRAHEMGTTHDWVVIYRDDELDDGRWTAITAQFGNLRGRRIILGLEKDCAIHHVLPQDG